MIKRFTAYRHNLAVRGTHTELQRNADNEPQYEGVVFSDGTCVIRWLTPCGSHSVWANLKDMLNVHGHPEYGTDIQWHDDAVEPAEWTAQKVAAAKKAAPVANYKV